MAAEIAIDIHKTFPGRATIRARIRYPVEASTVLILFGPSGSGKTTVLRSVAGLECPEQGTIRFISRTWLDTAAGVNISPQDRRIGYMAQEYALFPTYTVAGNIAYGLGHLSVSDRKRRVSEVLELFQLGGLESVKPRELSGGQQQRVALARAVAPRPQLLLLDEPLSALDAPTRIRLRGELRSLLKQLALPSIIVTHDREEALALGDVMAAMSDGAVLQVGTPQDVFSRPANAEVAKIVGVETVVQGRVLQAADSLVTIEVGEQTLTALDGPELGSAVFVCIRAEDVMLEKIGTAPTSARNHVKGIVRDIASAGPLVKVSLDCGFPLGVLVTRSALEELGLEPGSPVRAAIKAGSVHVVPRQEGN
ncbi:Molybdate/tungstate import ATP-binding protein WtpC [Nitrospira japonica]|uniref:Molybdate/tungstate import ATP-binding protein WtpC n=1 Tax=Nitrospira japonica TaxID=1325564 RepID=A0A1W1I7N8_9BACT|nr:ABC transporter ATP-binding protein [Nitrospira japonica]SLM49005.1 Molybdate/tungstate import ATP-binding protein WtpC [Nitrospira japonica]